MTARPLKYEGRDLHLALFGGPKLRDAYTGITPPAVAEPREPLRLVHMRRSGNVVLIAIAEVNDVTYLRVSSPDDPRLQVLGADDRGQVQGLLISIKREVGDAAT